MPCCCLLQDYIGRLTHEKGDLDKRFHGMKDELIARLQNACAQRDEARGQVRTCPACMDSAGYMASLLMQGPNYPQVPRHAALQTAVLRDTCALSLLLQTRRCVACGAKHYTLVLPC